MHALKMLAACLAALASLAAAAQSFPDERYRVKLTLSRVLRGAEARDPGEERRLRAPIMGAQELNEMLASQPDQNAVLDAPPPTLVRGRTYQLAVTITDPNGITRKYTGSPRLRYETFNCLTVTSTGVLTVAPIAGVPCANADSPELWVVLTDTGGTPIAMNSYMFRVDSAAVRPR